MYHCKQNGPVPELCSRSYNSRVSKEALKEHLGPKVEGADYPMKEEVDLMSNSTVSLGTLAYNRMKM